MFGRAMATRSDAFAVLLVISVCNLSRASSEGKGMIRENEGKMAEAWDHCMKEMKEKIVAVKDFDLYIPQATDDLISTLLTEQGIHKAINTLPPQVREGVIDCLRKNGLIFHASDPEVTSSYIRWHPSGGVLDYSLHVSKKVSGKGGKKKKNKGTKTVVIAIAATSVTTFILVAVIFFCCLRKMTEPKEEKPLLHLTDYLSEGSSHKSISLGSLSNKEPATSDHDDPSASSLPMEDKVSLLPKPPGSEVTTGAGLKPPPGRPFPPPPAPPPAAPSPAPRAPPLPPAHAAPPPPPPKGVRPPPPPKSKAGPPGGRKSEVSTDAESESSQKAKLKPFFWDKVAANTDQLMVWHEIRGGSFQFSEEMIEILFGCQATANKSNEKKEKLAEPSIQYIQIIDPRKAQNLAILLRALNITTQEVVNALKEGFRLPGELLQTLQKMTPTPDEELKLRLFAGDINLLGPAERFLKTVVEIPFAFKRIDALLFMSTFPEEAATLRESLSTLEVACTKLKNSRLFMKLLEAVLKTGNRMNDGTYRGGAQAFKLDTLLKLSDVKGTDGKTTLLHFVVQEIIRYEGIRCIRSESSSQGETLGNFKAVDLVEGNEQENEEHYRSLGLEVVSGVTTELDVVRKAAAIDADVLPSTVIKLDFGLKKAREFLNTDMKGTEEEAGQFYLSMSSFADAAEADIKFLSEEEKKIMELIKSTADYFHGQAGTKEGLRLFAIVRDFLTMLDKVCKEIRDTRAKQLAQKAKESKKEVSKARASQHNRQKSSSEPQQDKDSKKEGSSEPASIENQQQSSSEHQQFIDFQKEGSSAPASQENQQQLSLEHQQEKDSEKEGLLAPASQENQQQMSPENQQQLSSERQQEKDSEKEGSLVPVFQENQQQPSLEHQQDKDSKKDGSSAQTSQENQQQTLPENQQQRSSEHQQNKDSAVTASQENQQQMSSENQQQLSLEHQQDKDTEKYGLLAPASQGNQQQPSLEHQQDEDSKKEGSSAPASQENQQQTSLENQQQLSSKRQQDKDSEKEGSLAPASQENQQQSSLEHQQDKDSEKDGSLAPASKENQQHRSLENQQDEDSKKEGSSASASQENQQQTSLENQQQPSSKRQQDKDSEKEGSLAPASQENQQLSSLEHQQVKDSEKEGSFAPASQENQQQPSLEHQQDKDSEKEGSSAPTSQENQQQSSLELQQYKDSHKEDSSAPASQENQQQTSSETQQQPSSERQQGNDSEKEGSLAPALQENQQQSSLEHQKDNDSKRKDH